VTGGALRQRVRSHRLFRQVRVWSRWAPCGGLVVRHQARRDLDADADALPRCHIRLGKGGLAALSKTTESQGGREENVTRADDYVATQFRVVIFNSLISGLPKRTRHSR
jgi:hypothetical protein